MFFIIHALDKPGQTQIRLDDYRTTNRTFPVQASTLSSPILCWATIG